MGRTSLGKGGAFRKRKLDCPVSDGCRLLCSVGFVVGELLARNIVHRRPGQSMFHPSKDSTARKCTRHGWKCRKGPGKKLSPVSTIVNRPGRSLRGRAGGV